MEFDPLLAVGGLFVGFVVGLTGMGGGALMTPMLVLLFGVQPLAAVSSDLVASLVMKPIGGAVHARRGTVHKGLVTWLMIGSVPSAFLGVLLLRALGDGEAIQNVVKVSLGIALIVAASTLVAKAVLAQRARARKRAAGITSADNGLASITVRPIPTLIAGIVGGLVVGMTSVGSGSLIIVALLVIYPRLRAKELVGTDLVQAVPLVAAASVGHLLFGDFQLDLFASLLVGAIPGVYAGARVSATVPGGIVRRALVVVLVASGLKLIGVPTVVTGWILLGLAVGGGVVWALVRNTSGFMEPPHRVEGAGAARQVLDAVLGRPDRRTTSSPAPSTTTTDGSGQVSAQAPGQGGPDARGPGADGPDADGPAHQPRTGATRTP
ncbi:MAG: sulfite exporter TauE/SafE family protein [Actinomycetota bacterium]|nr:sulfite exporter TauE/SafE family protein [Actinomycetota bacterium]